MKNLVFRMSLVIAVVALSVAAFNSPASAQFYAGAKGSAFLPNDSADGLQDFDIGSGGEAFAGYRINPYFGLEAGTGYYQSKWTENNVEGLGIDAETTVSALPLTITVKSFWPLGNLARLYAGAGVGVYFAKAEAGASGEFEGLTYRISESDTDSAFGYHAVLGGEFMVASRVGLQGEVKWFQSEPKFSVADNEKVDIGGVLFSFGVLFQM